MTLNGSWGYQRADDNWKTPKTIVGNLIQCANGGGNYLLNIGPKGDGSIPPESVSVLTEVGKWLAHNGESIYETDRSNVSHSEYAQFTRKENTLYMHVHYWPGDYVAISGLETEVKSARFAATEKKSNFSRNNSARASQICQRTRPTPSSQPSPSNALPSRFRTRSGFARNARALASAFSGPQLCSVVVPRIAPINIESATPKHNPETISCAISIL